MNKIYFYSLYIFGLVLFVVGLFLPPIPSFCFVMSAIGLVSILTYVLFLWKLASKLQKFKFTLSVFVLVAIYHLAWLLVGFLEAQLHWSNGPESILFFYYMSISPLRILPKIFPHEGVNMILYSIAIPVLVGLCCDGCNFWSFKKKVNFYSYFSGEKMLFRKCLILLFVFVLFGCEDESVEDKDNVSEYLGLREKIDTVAYQKNRDYAHKYIHLDVFLSYYYRQNEDLISLDNDLIVLVEGIQSYYLYTQGKESAYKIWSSDCNVFETLSVEQVKILDSLVNDVKKEAFENPVKDEFYRSLFVWKGKGFVGALENRFECVLRGVDHYKSERRLYDYLKKEVFVHGCKKKRAIGRLPW